MRYFFDNYRGFSQKILDLSTVTFFVGENSTGKTSILKGISLLRDFGFWFNPSILPNFFLSYQDVCSQDCFTLGVVLEEPENGFCLFYFASKDGVTSLVKEIVYLKDLWVFCFSEREISYKFFAAKTFDSCSFFQELTDFLASPEYQNQQQTTLPLVNELPLQVEILDVLKKQNAEDHFKPFFFLLGGQISVAPIRAQPQQIYTNLECRIFADGHHTPSLLKNISISPLQDEKKREALRNFGKESGLFDDIDISVFHSASGEQQIGPFDPFSIKISKNKKKYNYHSVGYGVSQILPIIVDMLFLEAKTIIVQQPEIHLHPKAQAAFGEFVFRVASANPSKQIVIETHSDYIIDRFRYMQKKASEQQKVKSKVAFFSNNGENNITQDIIINEDGTYPESNILAFREFFLSESFKLLEI